MKRIFTIALTIASVLVAAPSAQADDQFAAAVEKKARAYQTEPAIRPANRTISTRTLQRWLHVATKVGQRKFPRTCKHPTFTALYAFGDTTLAQAELGVTLPTDGSKVERRCEVAFNNAVYRRMSWGLFCKTVVHELGHLAGRHHTHGSPRNVMYETEAWYPFAPCSRAMPQARKHVKALSSVRSSWG